MSATDPAPPPAISEAHVARGLGTTLLSRLGALIEVVAQPLYVAMFGLPAFGLYAVLWAAVNLAENIFDFGMTSALQRVVPQAHNATEELGALKAAFVGGVGPCTVVALIASFAAPSLARFVNVAAADQHLVTPAIALFAWALPLWAFVEIATSALRAKQLFGAEIRLRIFWEQIIRLVIAAALWALGYGLWGLLIGHMLSLAITAALSLRLLARHYPLRKLLSAPMQPMWGLTLGAGLSVLPANIVARLFGDAPPLILNALIPGAGGASAAALFVIIRKISSIVQLVRTAFAYVLAPIASLAAKHDMAQVSAIYGFATRLSASVALPIALTMAGASVSLLAAFNAEDQVLAVIGLVVMLLARGVEAATGPALPILQVIARFRSQFWASAVGLGAAILTAAIFAETQPILQFYPNMWLAPAAAAIAVGVVVAALVPALQLRLQTKVRRTGIVKPTLIGTLVGIVGLVCSIYISAAFDWPVALAAMLLVALLMIWVAVRTLPYGDRQALGRVGAALRLV